MSDKSKEDDPKHGFRSLGDFCRAFIEAETTGNVDPRLRPLERTEEHEAEDFKRIIEMFGGEE